MGGPLSLFFFSGKIGQFLSSSFYSILGIIRKLLNSLTNLFKFLSILLGWKLGSKPISFLLRSFLL